MLLSMDKLFAQGETVDTRSNIADDPKLPLHRLSGSPQQTLQQTPPVQQSQVLPALPGRISDQVNPAGAGSVMVPPRAFSPTQSVTVDRAGSPRVGFQGSGGNVRDSSSELFKEFQRQKQRLQEQLLLQVRICFVLIRLQR